MASASNTICDQIGKMFNLMGIVHVVYPTIMISGHLLLRPTGSSSDHVPGSGNYFSPFTLRGDFKNKKYFVHYNLVGMLY